jgi:hypothetical protein
MIKANWIISLKFNDIITMFDSVIERIIQLIDSQLLFCNNGCFALMLFGEFVMSKYLQIRIKKAFDNRVKLIFIPPDHETAIIEGGKVYKKSFSFYYQNL